LASSKVEQRAAELRDVLDYHLYRYHVLDDPEVTDAEYDVIYEELVRLEEANPDLVTKDSPTQRVGAPPSDKFQKVEHPSPMGSLEKVTTDEAVEKWHQDVCKRLGTSDVAYVTEPKIDGLSINLIYEEGVFVRGATRGDGRRGEDVTVNLRTIKPISMRMQLAAGETPPPLLEVRGEVYLPLSGFNELNERLVAEGKKPTPNPRNAAAGSLRRGRSRSGSTVSVSARAFLRPVTGRHCSGCGSTASGRTPTRSITTRWSPSRRLAGNGSSAASSSTTRSTGS
jgi:DNA ligase (NAD+)